MAMSPVGLGTKNNCAGDDQQQFTRPTDSVLGIATCYGLDDGGVGF
jgi:hypothetical protein